MEAELEIARQWCYIISECTILLVLNGIAFRMIRFLWRKLKYMATTPRNKWDLGWFNRFIRRDRYEF